MTRYMSTTAATLLALSMSTTAAMAQEANTFDFWNDFNKAGQESAYADFNTAFTDYGLFDTWDEDADEMLSKDELSRGLYATYDADRDEMLNEQEVAGMGQDRLFAERDLGLGNEIGFEEFDTGLEENWDEYERWDADQNQMLTRDEFNRGVFDLFDADRDEVLNADEIATARESRIFTY